MHFFIWARWPSVQVSPHHRRSTSPEAFGTPPETFRIPLYWLDSSNRRFDSSVEVSVLKSLNGTRTTVAKLGPRNVESQIRSSRLGRDPSHASRSCPSDQERPLQACSHRGYLAWRLAPSPSHE